MSKPDRSERYKTIDVQLSQGVRSRHHRLCEAIFNAEEMLESDPYKMTKPELNDLRQQLEVATANLHELFAYRKMMGLD